ncbi:F-box-like domain protein, putative [Rhizoctonia solani AG-3 Rhs1AP]|uniref:F-box-like domain protein, putative n=1 Tax=Rhizoctonia solani AG-3 Rhs1AP TaxID=1086054 RepID=X8IZ25_9AGAM|nr:F-box-like domain protein, putative [Rhizoctonia solani AG-3 Rhs1AP]
MLDELITASDLLFAALEKYSVVCSTIRQSCARGDKPRVAIHQLLLRMDTEIKLAPSLEVKLRQAKTAMSWSMNRILSNVRTTVNSLPPEILFRIFHLVLSSQPCAKRDYPYPIVLSHVCSRWRDITLNSPSLWSHLDIATSQLLNRQRLYDRTELHLNQVGQLPLDLHVFNPIGYSVATSHSSDFTAVVQLIARLASRTYSFELDARYGYFHPGHGEILSHLFQDCVPGKLTQLTLRRPMPEHRMGYVCAR